MNLKKNISIVVIIAFLLLFPVIFKSGYIIQFAINIIMFAYLASSWNIIGGYAGQLALGNGVYFGLGAYVSTVLFMYKGLSPWIGMFIGAAIAGLISLFIGNITFRLSGTYYALSTVALLFIVRIIFVSNTKILGFKTNGALGLQVPWKGESFLNMQFVNKAYYYYIILVIFAIGLLISWYIKNSKTGYYLAAINTNPEAASSLGVHVTGMKLKAGFIAAALTAIGGTFYAMVFQIVDPFRVLGYDLSIQILLYAIVGGGGTIWGPVIASLILVPINDILRAKLGSAMAGMSLVVYGLVFMIIVYFMPHGIWEPVSKIINKLFMGKKQLKLKAR